ncbi:ParB/RepB/Spo0J family partition protein [Aestuariicoccus sp. MJ-SS9]|uniref:ParB/RepB/Spo0J family partition protein n=1 Tax=Aestuariicoccus sp. MJ-SS9 TaxID=3079855 RepID=UPI0029125F96|nr:ParB N-terminal domain-containing protein [Aestuariicoccus sp. MJ-SS9]MDU8912139.1 ParB N-terminal domain-containing protein [Aestuariicoccus sp. MJ-SS9]
MAKRKRLTPANPLYLGDAPAPETKSLLRAAPIADVARDAATSHAAAEMAETLQKARAEGRMIVPLALAEIQFDHLVRDRIIVEDDEMEALVNSLRDRGQQTPIEVVELPRGGYGLISGWRRCQALIQLGRDEVLALIRRPETAAEAYQAMVEENEIRVGLSYFERARIVAKAAEEGVYRSEKEALLDLFRAASRPKRSKIGGFLPIVHHLSSVLQFPQALSERGGLALGRALEEDAGLGARLQAALRAARADTPEAEAEVIAAAMEPPQPAPRNTVPDPAPPAPAPGAAEDRRGREVAPGIWLRTAANGDITLSGPGLTPEKRAALKRWLAEK